VAIGAPKTVREIGSRACYAERSQAKSCVREKSVSQAEELEREASVF